SRTHEQLPTTDY
ncbi:hypothetical protein CFC21_054913, partial [Triticum aestivum]